MLIENKIDFAQNNSLDSQPRSKGGLIWRSNFQRGLIISNSPDTNFFLLNVQKSGRIFLHLSSLIHFLILILLLASDVHFQHWSYPHKLTWKSSDAQAQKLWGRNRIKSVRWPTRFNNYVLI